MTKAELLRFKEQKQEINKNLAFRLSVFLIVVTRIIRNG
jgi:hypothetical protein